jgi:hypothetical protein
MNKYPSLPPPRTTRFSSLPTRYMGTPVPSKEATVTSNAPMLVPEGCLEDGYFGDSERREGRRGEEVEAQSIFNSDWRR